MYKKIASNTIAQIISKALTAFISIFLIGLLTKYLPMELYGSYNKVYSYLWIFAFLADLWLYTIAIREISQKKESTETIVWNILTLRTILWVWVVIIALFWALFLPWYNDFLTLSAIAIVWVFTVVSLINSSLLALMQSQMKMEFSLISVVAGKVLNISLIAYFLIFVFTGPGEVSIAFLSVFFAGLLWISLNTYMNYLYAKKITTIRYRFDIDYIKYIFKISLPYGIALFLSVVYFKIDVILLSLMEVPKQADISIALYGLPMKIVEVLMVLWWFYLNSILPNLSEKFSQGKQAELSHMLWVSVKVLLSFALFICVVGNLFASQIINIIATPEYIDPMWHVFNSVQALSLVLGVLVFHFIALAFIYMMIASERQSLLLWVNLWVTVLNIIWNILLIPHFSFIGAAMVTLGTQFILMCITGYLVLKNTHISWKIGLNCVLSIFFAITIFTVFSKILSTNTWWDITTILIFWPIIFWIYLMWEYFFSRKLF